jgi:nitrous oxide reductase accessory protein NosL
MNGAPDSKAFPTVKLKARGVVVLARLVKGEARAMTFANRTQAEAAAARTGGTVVRWGRPWFVRLDD